MSQLQELGKRGSLMNMKDALLKRGSQLTGTPRSEDNSEVGPVSGDLTREGDSVLSRVSAATNSLSNPEAARPRNLSMWASDTPVTSMGDPASKSGKSTDSLPELGKDVLDSILDTSETADELAALDANHNARQRIESRNRASTQPFSEGSVNSAGGGDGVGPLMGRRAKTSPADGNDGSARKGSDYLPSSMKSFPRGAQPDRRQLGSLTGSAGLPDIGEAEPNGITTVMFSISAGEGRNIILRNLLGKVAANLNLISQLHGGALPPASPLQFIDGFADEGHRLGAFYLMRAVCVAFYQAMSPPVALKIANVWLERMNGCDAASDVGVFDKDVTDVFALLPETHQRRSEVAYIRFFHNLFPVLNSFSVPVDFLFDKVLELPYLFFKAHREAVEFVREAMTSYASGKEGRQERIRSQLDAAKNLLRDDTKLDEFMTKFKFKERKPAGYILKQVLQSAQHRTPHHPPTYLTPHYPLSPFHPSRRCSSRRSRAPSPSRSSPSS